MAKPLQQDENGNIINDVETKKTQKGFANYEKENQSAQKAMENKDAKFKETIKTGVEKIRGVMGMKKGGSVKCKSIDGCAIRGKTRAK
jgi:hypothetical protein